MKANVEKIKNLMDEKSMTIYSLSERSGLEQKTVENLLLGATSPRPYTVGLAAQALNVDSSEICHSASFLELEMARRLLHVFDLMEMCNVSIFSLRKVINGKNVRFPIAKAIADGIGVDIGNIWRPKNGKL